ncbi:MAG: DEAD/DEAH box helicase family protein, partial [Thermoleophilia bacterium]|nr:DEAD/DEAH box helicase family protein [Thermoleophilia bacterium]
MPDLVSVTYAQTGESTKTNEMGMRDMQAKAFAARESQYLLLKAPPASGKSRALMFLALDKLFNQGLKKAIVAVPERAIGASFANTKLTEHGFFADWEVAEKNNLCLPGSSESKVQRLVEFLNSSSDATLVCTHATIRFAFDAVPTDAFNDVVLAIDEFHHVSADKESSKLGALLHGVMTQTNA